MANFCEDCDKTIRGLLSLHRIDLHKTPVTFNHGAREITLYREPDFACPYKTCEKRYERKRSLIRHVQDGHKESEGLKSWVTVSF
jgi:hypothetical protein